MAAIFRRIQLSMLRAICNPNNICRRDLFFFSVLAKSGLRQKWDRRRRVYFYKARTLLQRRLILLPWILDREMGRRLILHKTGFTPWRFFTSYFIDVDAFYLFLNWFSTRVTDDRKYVCCRRLYARINTRKFKGLDSREITSLQEIKKVIYAARHVIIAENEPHAHHKTHSHTMKVYNHHSFANSDSYFFSTTL